MAKLVSRPAPDLTFDHRYIMSRLAQEPGTRHPDNAGTQHEHAQTCNSRQRGECTKRTLPAGPDFGRSAGVSLAALSAVSTIRAVRLPGPLNIVWRCGHCCTTLSRGENNHEPSAFETCTRGDCRRVSADRLQPAGDPSRKTAAPAPAPAPAKAAGSDVVKIGHVGPISGAIAHLGKDNENGARLAVEEINAAGGVKVGDKTVKLDLVTGDDKADPKDGTLVAQKMIDEGVVALVGHLNSGTTIPASKLYSDANLSHISPSATAVKFTEQGFKTTFRVVARDDKQGAALANFAAGPLKAKTVAVIDDRTPYGQGLADEFEKFAKEKGMKVVGREFTNDKASDFNAILTKVRSLKPDVVMYGGMDATAGPMAKQMKAARHEVDADRR